ncbi:O-methyltransferase involved in polyketide biosynthesis [Mycobacterium frederiksbergense]|uniref:O-methyltransferase involved in polyketide biosynthesis n=1 Tax=Mycolicibacterium frederiksbergense TaxID=117567 RepID=A0ABT6KTG3_9MYCO|nr:class I SAM-dependent methyltransferase [Mycolicibacterium frederiksbergense]MDH6194018.1 O-methyltransferase involved in polyketide biosynthesis [Mycolicibacterium frederiksbergense]
MSKVEPELGNIQETLLIPLYGRARDAMSRHPVLNDQRAVELINTIDYDFTKFTGPSLPGSVLRTAIFDGWVRRFLDTHPTGTVVELGTGLNTRFDRLDNGQLHWFDLDLPDSIALRRKFFTDGDRYTMLAGSVLDTDWFDAIADAPAPYLFVSEAVLVYLSEDQVRTAVAQLAKRFDGSLIALDTGGATMMRNQHRNATLKPLTARMQWICDDPRQLEHWGLRLHETRTFAQPQPEVAKTWPARYRYGLPLMARLAPPIINAYKLSLFQLDARP